MGEADLNRAWARYPSLAGRRVLVTGGSSGIGADLVAAFAGQGAQVAFTGRNAQAAQALIEGCAAREVGPIPSFHRCDMADPQALRDALQVALEALQGLDVLVNNVADDRRHEFLSLDPLELDRLIAINLRAPFLAAQIGVAAMCAQGWGCVINLGSTGWKNKVAGYAAYATCKSAVNGLTRSLAREFGPRGIRVNTLTPGWVMTPKQLDHWVDDAGRKAMAENHCIPGEIQGEDVARLALFLASDDSRMITAQEFVIDAGWT